MNRLHKAAALTLIELVVVMTITALIMLSFSGYIRQALNTWSYISYRSDIVNDARLGLIRMGKNIREMASLDSANANALGFVVNSNAALPHLRYRFDSGNNTVFYEESNSANGNFASYPLMKNVAAYGNFFDYFYATNMSGANMSDANVVSFASNNGLIIRLKPRFSEKGQTFNADYDISPRNF